MSYLSLFSSCLESVKNDPAVFLICIASIPLVYFDLKYHAYPLVLWAIFFVLLFLIIKPNLLILGCLLLASLTTILELKMGAGDWLYLSLISFSLSFFQFTFCLLLASTLALTYYLFFINKKKKEIPFLPFLFVAYLVTIYLSPFFEKIVS